MNIIDKLSRKVLDKINRNEEDTIKSLIPEIYNLKYDYTQIRNKQLSKKLNYAYNHCEYYKDIFDKNAIDISDEESFYKIPFLTRTLIRENKKNIISNQRNWIYHYYEKTGGTTGEPLNIALTYKSQRIDNYHYNEYARIMGYKKGDAIISFGASPLALETRENGIYWKFLDHKDDLPYGRINLSRLYFNPDTAKYYIKIIEVLSPAFLRGTPSFIFEIADYIPFVKDKLKAETITPAQIDMLKSKFDCKIYLQYGHTEKSIYSYTIDHSYKYYTSPLIGLVEIIDEAGNHVKEGETGEVVTTGFHNQIIPFIRYKTSDLAQYLGEKNGVVILGRIEGRTQDMLFDWNGRRTTLFDFHRYFDKSDKIKAFQTHQFENGKLVVKVIADDFTQKDKDDIIEVLRICNFESVIEVVDDLPVTARGKRIWVVQHLDGI